MKTPVSLLERLKNGRDQESWAQFVQLYFPFICYWARRTGLQDADVADLAQEVFLLLHRKLPGFRYEPGKSFRAWLRTVTVNKWRELKRSKLALAGSFDTADGPVLADPAEELWEADHQRYVATRALQMMRTDFEARTWQACWDTAVEDQPAQAVADRLGLTPGAVYAAKFRVLRRLREALAELID